LNPYRDGQSAAADAGTLDVEVVVALGNIRGHDSIDLAISFRVGIPDIVHGQPPIP
jgi:hypothetical protein